MKIITFVLVVLFLNIGSKCRNSIGTNDKDNRFCPKIDTLVKERYEWKTGNYYANRIVPELESQIGIEAQCQKGSFGYLYLSDSAFNRDVQKWKKYFHCY